VSDTDVQDHIDYIIELMKRENPKENRKWSAASLARELEKNGCRGISADYLRRILRRNRPLAKSRHIKEIAQALGYDQSSKEYQHLIELYADNVVTNTLSKKNLSDHYKNTNAPNFPAYNFESESSTIKLFSDNTSFYRELELHRDAYPHLRVFYYAVDNCRKGGRLDLAYAAIHALAELYRFFVSDKEGLLWEKYDQLQLKITQLYITILRDGGKPVPKQHLDYLKFIADIDPNEALQKWVADEYKRGNIIDQ
jgi:hypothetical protein